MRALTAGKVLDLLQRANSVILNSEGADEHAELTSELEAAAELIAGEIGSSHMGTGADVVLVERGDGGGLISCGKCGDEYDPRFHDEECPHERIERADDHFDAEQDRQMDCGREDR